MIKFIPTIVHNFRDLDEDIGQVTQGFSDTWDWFLECQIEQHEPYCNHISLFKKIDYKKSHKLQHKLLNLVEKESHMSCIDRHEVFFMEGKANLGYETREVE